MSAREEREAMRASRLLSRASRVAACRLIRWAVSGHMGAPPLVVPALIPEIAHFVCPKFNEPFVFEKSAAADFSHQVRSIGTGLIPTFLLLHFW